MARLTKKEATKRQMEYLKAIKGFVKKNGYFPKLRDVCEMMGHSGSSTQSVREILDRLIIQGYIIRKKSYNEITIEVRRDGNKTYKTITRESPFKLSNKA